ncbi:DUF2510 domain-containing protein [Microbacterium hydrocarbonoxydans]|uniref:DUF2510 domain-containing protein n=1 Tax=Microbacterium hydrocarbonoxydans TaxID=273678 RepID=UPI003D9729E0
MQAGWYDDGSGRQRWWDGEQWTDDFAPGQAAAPVSSAPPGSLSVSKGPAPVLGFVGLGLAVAGTVLACIPAVFGIGVVVLLAGFVVSLIGLFRKGATKWPSIVGMILAVIGGAIGTVVLIASLVANLPGPVDPTTPTDAPSTSTQQPTDTPTSGTAEGRLSPEELGERVKEMLHDSGITEHDTTPNFYPCMGQFLYDSELSDETLRLVTSGQDPLEAEREAAGQAIIDGTLACEDAGAAAN